MSGWLSRACASPSLPPDRQQNRPGLHHRPRIVAATTPRPHRPRRCRRRRYAARLHLAVSCRSLVSSICVVAARAYRSSGIPFVIPSPPSSNSSDVALHCLPAARPHFTNSLCESPSANLSQLQLRPCRVHDREAYPTNIVRSMRNVCKDQVRRAKIVHSTTPRRSSPTRAPVLLLPFCCPLCLPRPVQGPVPVPVPRPARARSTNTRNHLRCRDHGLSIWLTLCRRRSVDQGGETFTYQPY